MMVSAVTVLLYKSYIQVTFFDSLCRDGVNAVAIMLCR